MVQGEATSRLAMTATRNMAINPITGDAVIEDEGFRAFFEGYDGLKNRPDGRRAEAALHRGALPDAEQPLPPGGIRPDRDGGADSADLLRAAAGLSRR